MGVPGRLSSCTYKQIDLRVWATTLVVREHEAQRPEKAEEAQKVRAAHGRRKKAAGKAGRRIKARAKRRNDVREKRGGFRPFQNWNKSMFANVWAFSDPS